MDDAIGSCTGQMNDHCLSGSEVERGYDKNLKYSSICSKDSTPVTSRIGI